MPRTIPGLIILLLILLCIHIPNIRAQISRLAIRGAVIDASTGEALSGVNVRLGGGSVYAVTDERGGFVLEGEMNHEGSILLSRVGYIPSTIPVRRFMNAADSVVVCPMQQKILEMGAVTVTAQRREVEVFDSPYAVSVIDEEHLDRVPSQGAADALQDVPGIAIQKTSTGGGAVFLRGMIGNQTLVLIDGVRMNNSTYRYGPNQYMATIDSWMVERAEVVRGPTSVLYGSDAMGGVVQYFTRTPELSQDGFRSKFFGNQRLASADGEKTGRIEWQGASEKVGWIAGFTRRTVGDLRHGTSGTPPNPLYANLGDTHTPTGWNESDFDGKLRWQIARDMNMIFAYQGVRQPTVPRYDKYGPGNHDLYVYSPQNRDLGYAKFTRASAGGPVQFLQAILSFHRQSEGRTSHRINTTKELREFDRVDTYGLNVQATSSAGRRHTLSYGFDVYHDYIRSSKISVNTETGAESYSAGMGKYPTGATYTGYGVFFQDEIALHRRLRSILGLRYNAFNIAAPFPEDGPEALRFGRVELRPNSLTGNAGMVFSVTPSVNIVGNISQAFRAPSMENLAQVGEGDGGYEVPNTGAKPERMTSYETGVKIYTAGFSLSSSVFYSSISDLLLRRPTTYLGLPYYVSGRDTLDVVYQANAAETYITGVELGGELIAAPGLTLFGTFTYLYGEDVTHNTPLQRIPPKLGTVGLDWKQHSFWMRGYCRYAGKQDRLSPADKKDIRIPPGGTPAWWTLNIMAGKRLSDWLELHGGVENILDKDYRMHGSGVNAPGTNFIATLRLLI